MRIIVCPAVSRQAIRNVVGAALSNNRDQIQPQMDLQACKEQPMRLFYEIKCGTDTQKRLVRKPSA